MIKIFKQSKIDKNELDNTLLMISKQLISNTIKFIIDKVKFNEKLITVNSSWYFIKRLNSIVKNFLDFDKIKEDKQYDMIKKNWKNFKFKKAKLLWFIY